MSKNMPPPVLGEFEQMVMLASTTEKDAPPVRVCPATIVTAASVVAAAISRRLTAPILRESTVRQVV